MEEIPVYQESKFKIMTTKRSTKTSWLNADLKKSLLNGLGRIALTAISVFLGLWGNQWREDHQNLKQEKQSLEQIKVGLSDDIKDLKETKQLYSVRFENIKSILLALEPNTAPLETLSQKIDSLVGIGFFLPNTAAYETLKSKGMENIKNDSLRTGMSTLYEFGYPGLLTLEKQQTEIHNELLMPYLFRSVLLTKQQYKPNEIAKLKNDREFKQMLRRVSRLDSLVTEEYSKSMKSVLRLSNEIDIELKSGRF